MKPKTNGTNNINIQSKYYQRQIYNSSNPQNIKSSHIQYQKQLSDYKIDNSDRNQKDKIIHRSIQRNFDHEKNPIIKTKVMRRIDYSEEKKNFNSNSIMNIRPKAINKSFKINNEHNEEILRYSNNSNNQEYDNANRIFNNYNNRYHMVSPKNYESHENSYTKIYVTNGMESDGGRDIYSTHRNVGMRKMVNPALRNYTSSRDCDNINYQSLENLNSRKYNYNSKNQMELNKVKNNRLYIESPFTQNNDFESPDRDKNGFHFRNISLENIKGKAPIYHEKMYGRNLTEFERNGNYYNRPNKNRHNYNRNLNDDNELYDIINEKATQIQSFVRSFLVRKKVLRFITLEIYYQSFCDKIQDLLVWHVRDEVFPFLINQLLRMRNKYKNNYKKKNEEKCVCPDKRNNIGDNNTISHNYNYTKKENYFTYNGDRNGIKKSRYDDNNNQTNKYDVYKRTKITEQKYNSDFELPESRTIKKEYSQNYILNNKNTNHIYNNSFCKKNDLNYSVNYSTDYQKIDYSISPTKKVTHYYLHSPCSNHKPHNRFYQEINDKTSTYTSNYKSKLNTYRIYNNIKDMKTFNTNEKSYKYNFDNNSSDYGTRSYSRGIYKTTYSSSNQNTDVCHCLDGRKNGNESTEINYNISKKYETNKQRNIHTHKQIRIKNEYNLNRFNDDEMESDNYISLNIVKLPQNKTTEYSKTVETKEYIEDNKIEDKKNRRFSKIEMNKTEDVKILQNPKTQNISTREIFTNTPKEQNIISKTEVINISSKKKKEPKVDNKKMEVEIEKRVKELIEIEKREIQKLDEERKERERKSRMEQEKRDKERERREKEKRNKEELLLIEREKKITEEMEKIEREKKEIERKQREAEKERERAEKERKEREEREKLEREKRLKEEEDRKERERREKERKEKLERERREREKKEMEEQLNLERERIIKEEKERLEKEMRERERKEKELRMKKEREERLKREKEERERLEREKKMEEERLERERKLEEERKERERKEKERKDKLEREKRERERKEKEEQLRKEREKKRKEEQERIEKERKEKEKKAEQERIERERKLKLEQEKREKEKKKIQIQVKEAPKPQKSEETIKKVEVVKKTIIDKERISQFEKERKERLEKRAKDKEKQESQLTTTTKITTKQYTKISTNKNNDDNSIKTRKTETIISHKPKAITKKEGGGGKYPSFGENGEYILKKDCQKNLEEVKSKLIEEYERKIEMEKKRGQEELRINQENIEKKNRKEIEKLKEMHKQQENERIREIERVREIQRKKDIEFEKLKEREKKMGIQLEEEKKKETIKQMEIDEKNRKKNYIKMNKEIEINYKKYEDKDKNKNIKITKTRNREEDILKAKEIIKLFILSRADPRTRKRKYFNVWRRKARYLELLENSKIIQEFCRSNLEMTKIKKVVSKWKLLSKKIFYKTRIKILKMKPKGPKISKRKRKLYELIKITRLTSIISRRRFIHFIILVWNIYAKNVHKKRVNMKYIYENLLKTYMSLANDIFGNNQYENPSVQDAIFEAVNSNKFRSLHTDDVPLAKKHYEDMRRIKYARSRDKNPYYKGSKYLNYYSTSTNKDEGKTNDENKEIDEEEDKNERRRRKLDFLSKYRKNRSYNKDSVEKHNFSYNIGINKDENVDNKKKDENNEGKNSSKFKFGIKSNKDKDNKNKGLLLKEENINNNNIYYKNNVMSKYTKTEENVRTNFDINKTESTNTKSEYRKINKYNYENKNKREDKDVSSYKNENNTKQNYKSDYQNKEKEKEKEEGKYQKKFNNNVSVIYSSNLNQNNPSNTYIFKSEKTIQSKNKKTEENKLKPSAFDSNQKSKYIKTEVEKPNYFTKTIEKKTITTSYNYNVDNQEKNKEKEKEGSYRYKFGSLEKNNNNNKKELQKSNTESKMNFVYKSRHLNSAEKNNDIKNETKIEKKTEIKPINNINTINTSTGKKFTINKQYKSNRFNQ